jgi:hypothetical protein
LGNRVQHALRAFTPRDQKAVKAAADTFRPNPQFETASAITQLAVGEALVSMLEGKGTPQMVERTLIAPPGSRVGPLSTQERSTIVAASPLRGKYDTEIDRESAFEILSRRNGGSAAPVQPQSPWGQSANSPNAGQSSANAPANNAPAAEPSGGGLMGGLGNVLGGVFGESTPSANATSSKGRQRMSTGELIVRSVAQSAARSVGTQITRAILRGVLGGLTGR